MIVKFRGDYDVRVKSIQHVLKELERIAKSGDADETYLYLDVRK